MRLSRFGGVCLVAFGLLAAWPVATAPVCAREPKGTPFPVTKTTKLTAKRSPYIIDGPTVIPKTAEVTVQLGVRIIGINNASLDVRGGLKIHGTQDRWVKITNVDFSPTKMPHRGLHLDMVDFYGCKFKHGEDGELGGKITIENSTFQRDCEFDIRFLRGFLKIMTVEWGMPCRIRCDRQKENPVPIEVEIRSSWCRAVEISGPAMANLRHSEIRGGLTCRNVTELTVDGCDITNELAIHQGPEDSFKKITLTKCNLFDGAELILDRPAGQKTKTERVRLNKFYFGPRGAGKALKDKKQIAERIKDGADNERVSVKATWTKPNKRKHLLVNYDTLRTRVPPLN